MFTFSKIAIKNESRKYILLSLYLELSNKKDFMEKNKTCERNWINKGSFKQYSVCSAIIQSHIFARINGIAIA